LKLGVAVARNLNSVTIDTKIFIKSAVKKNEINWKNIPFEGNDTKSNIGRLNIFKRDKAKTTNQKDLSSNTT
jgi:hypothetical protein